MGETARNLYTRAKEHEENYRKGKQKLFMKKHQDQVHNGVAGSYIARVTASHQDCLSRQVSEG